MNTLGDIDISIKTRIVLIEKIPSRVMILHDCTSIGWWYDDKKGEIFNISIFPHIHQELYYKVIDTQYYEYFIKKVDAIPKQ